MGQSLCMTLHHTTSLDHSVSQLAHCSAPRAQALLNAPARPPATHWGALLSHRVFAIPTTTLTNNTRPNANPNAGLPQLGTLGAGNHYAEVQVVEEIFDPFAARRMGIERKGVSLSFS